MREPTSKAIRRLRGRRERTLLGFAPLGTSLMMEIHHGTMSYSCNMLEIHRRWRMNRFSIGGRRRPDGGRAGPSRWSVSHFHTRKVFPTSVAPAKHSNKVISQQGRLRNGEIWKGGKNESLDLKLFFMSSMEMEGDEGWEGAGVRFVPLGHENQSKDKAGMGVFSLLTFWALWAFFQKSC